MYQPTGLRANQSKNQAKVDLETAGSCKPLKAQMFPHWQGWLACVGGTFWKGWKRYMHEGGKRSEERTRAGHWALSTFNYFASSLTKSRCGVECIERGSPDLRACMFVPASIATLNFKPISSGARSTCARRAKQGQFSLQYYAGRCATKT